VALKQRTLWPVGPEEFESQLEPGSELLEVPMDNLVVVDGTDIVKSYISGYY
jgi:hypothetical protein